MKRARSMQHRLATDVNGDLDAWVREVADREGRTVSEVVRLLLASAKQSDLLKQGSLRDFHDRLTRLAANRRPVVDTGEAGRVLAFAPPAE